jgi:tetratricopeptide (TPR) repeat protein
MSDLDQAEQALGAAEVALMGRDLDAVVAHLSAAIRSFSSAGEPCRAAMACVRLGDVLANGLGNLTAGRAWFSRARRLVEDQPPCLEQGWVAVAALGCDVDDPSELLAAAELALDRARRFGDVNLEAKALADAGLAHVQAGRIDEGMAVLDEAMALACGPVDDGDTAAKSACSFFTACYFAGDFQRASSWADLMRRQGLIGTAPGGPVFLSSHCDSVQATLLIELGRWGEAEELLLRSRSEFEAAMGQPSWHPDIALADLRIRQGRLAEAEQLLLGKDQSMQALLPAIRMHLERGDHQLARSAIRRGLRLVGDDKLRRVELLTALVDAELAGGDLAAALDTAAALQRVEELRVPALAARATAARSRALVASGELGEAIALLEATVDELVALQLPWLRATLLVELARFRVLDGRGQEAVEDAKAASAILSHLDVVLAGSDGSVLEHLGVSGAGPTTPVGTARLQRDGKWWVVAAGGTSVKLADTKGLRYLAELVARPGVEHHALDLVDRADPPPSDAGVVPRRSLGDAGELIDPTARAAYRRRIEQLRGAADEALAMGRLEEAEALQSELDLLVSQLAAAFGLGGRARKAASAAERARLNVTRALRTAIAKLSEAMPEAGGVLDRHVRTGIYCVYEPPPSGELRWIVQS